MAKPDAQHEVMQEALLKRLRQFYPEPPYRYSEGRVVRPPGLKPDIYVEHPDGKKWVFEMVHHNHHATHLRDNHGRYAEAGIHDTWILWQDLEPSAGKPRPLDQGIMRSFLSEQRLYRLTAPQRTILAMQEAPVRTLYAFSINPLGTEARAEPSSFSRTTQIGVTIYCFEGWTGQARYPARDTFVALHEIEFADDGSLVAAPEPNEEVLASLADQYGLSSDKATMVPSEVLARLDQLPAMIQRDAMALLGPLLKQHLATLSPEEIQGIQAFFQSGVPAHPAAKDLPKITIDEALGSSAGMTTLADGLQQVIQQLQDQGMPKALLAFFLQWLDPQKLAQMAELMQWQEGSDALRDARQDS